LIGSTCRLGAFAFQGIVTVFFFADETDGLVFLAIFAGVVDFDKGFELFQV
jgi:hypothetical protein